MGDSRSFEKLNYSIRPNKNVERKLMVKLLRTIGSTGHFDVKNHQYIGFGSIWFVDFSLFHRALGIVDMISVEKEASRAQRLRFNKPFDCVRLILREYSDAFVDLNWDKRSIVWLDFDDVVKPALFSDLKRTLLKVQSGSFVFVSVNADSWQLSNVSEEERSLSPADALQLVVEPANLPADYDKRISRALFPALVGDILENAFKNAISESRPELSFAPVINLTYADNVPMVTYGGIVLSGDDRAIFDGLELGHLKYLVGPPQFELAVPNLTFKEKMRFDQLLPRVGIPNSDQLGFELRNKEIDAYVRFYLEYPLYGEYQF
jgi:hypothetical protein